MNRKLELLSGYLKIRICYKGKLHLFLGPLMKIFLLLIVEEAGITLNMRKKSDALITILILSNKEKPTFEGYYRLRDALLILEFNRSDREEIEIYLDFRKDGNQRN